MARINVETSLWASAAFQRFLITVGDRHKAIGQIVDLWTIAQEHWFQDKGLIPEDEFRLAGLSEALIESGLAERRDGGIYARGSERHFAWYFEKREAGRTGGRVSAQRPRDENGRFLPKHHPSTIQAPSKQEPSETKCLQPSSSYSYSKTAGLVDHVEELRSEIAKFPNAIETFEAQFSPELEKYSGLLEKAFGHFGRPGTPVAVRRLAPKLIRIYESFPAFKAEFESLCLAAEKRDDPSRYLESSIVNIVREHEAQEVS